MLFGIEFICRISFPITFSCKLLYCSGSTVTDLLYIHSCLFILQGATRLTSYFTTTSISRGVARSCSSSAVSCGTKVSFKTMFSKPSFRSKTNKTNKLFLWWGTTSLVRLMDVVATWELSWLTRVFHSGFTCQIIHRLTPEKGAHQFRYFLLMNTYWCLLMHKCISIYVGSNVYTSVWCCTHWIPFQ